MTLCCGMSSSQSLEGSYCFHFQASSSPRIKSSTFFVCTIFPHNTPFKRKYVGQTGMLTFVCCTIWTLTRQAYSTDEYRAIDKEKLQYLKKQLCLLSTTNHKCSTLGLKLGLGSEKSAEVSIGWRELTRPTLCVTLTIVKQNSLQDMVSHTFQSYSVSKTFFGFH